MTVHYTTTEFIPELGQWIDFAHATCDVCDRRQPTDGDEDSMALGYAMQMAGWVHLRDANRDECPECVERSFVAAAR